MLDVDLSNDERFVTEYERFRHRSALAEILQQRLIDAVLSDPQFQERGMLPRTWGATASR
ncbi:hypothetical protein ACIA5H_36260 [Nocardia sp. NPDC051900]|uniref:hypothetical protein n=1 Tax=Nocardia sp. NPDC051900 TaxID=3364326 RepID=UPI0037928C26